MGGSSGMIEGLKAAGDDSPVYGNLTRLSSDGKIVPSGMAGGAPDPGYTNAPLTQSRYTPSYSPQGATPFLQSIMSQHGTPLQQGNSLGLPSLQSMFGMQQGNAPYQSGLQQLAPLTPYVGSTYRPDMSGAMAKLNEVAPSVSTQQARDAAAKAKWDAEHPVEAAMQNYSGGFN